MQANYRHFNLLARLYAKLVIAVARKRTPSANYWRGSLLD